MRPRETGTSKYRSRVCVKCALSAGLGLTFWQFRRGNLSQGGGRNRTMGEQMTSMMVDGVKVIKPDETRGDEKNRQADALSMFRIWSLLTGADQMRDVTVANEVHC